MTSRWADEPGVQRGAEYDERWARMAAAGHSIHGEADFICQFSPQSVLDAGCGTGRVAIELAARGIDVVGVDLDAPMIEQARRKAPELTWVEHDLVDVDLGRDFEVVALPGNVMIFLRPGTEAQVVANLARHVGVGGVMIAGFQLGHRYGIDDYERDCAATGLRVDRRHATWHGDPWAVGGDYVVSVHYRPDAAV